MIAEGTASELKAKVGKDRLELIFADDKALQAAKKILDGEVIDSNDKEHSLTTVINDTNLDVKRALNALTDANIKLQSLSVHQPTLDDVFLSLTGKQKADDTTEESEEA